MTTVGRVHTTLGDDYVVDGDPVVTGLAPVGDAWACTNPSAGRGMSLGLVQAQVLRQVTAAHLDDPATLARVYALRTEREVAPYYRNQVRADRQRVAEMVAIREGREPPAPDPTTARFLAAARTDADALRAFLETVQCLALPHEVLARPAVARALAAVDGPPPPLPGPDRAELLRLLAG
jgi:2-polyprenyl-6-methoxyphenol hydroxylase-like FAD-dependent oxidoreductase